MMLTTSIPSLHASNLKSPSQITTLALIGQSIKPSLTNYAPSLHLRRQLSALNPSTNISTSQKSSRFYHGVRLNCRCCALQDKSSEVGETVTKVDDKFSSADQVASSVTVSQQKQNRAVASEEENGSALNLTERTEEAPPTHVLGTANELSMKQLWIAKIEGRIERAIFDFRFLTLMAVGGSLAGSLLCFLKGCGFICESFIAYFSTCMYGVHTGKVILRLVEAVDVFLAGTVMLIFGMGLYGLFISNVSSKTPPEHDRALKNTSLFGMFGLKTRPRWMKIASLDELKTKLGHVIVMILLVKMFEKSKTVVITSTMDLLYYSVSIFLSSASLYVLQRLHN